MSVEAADRVANFLMVWVNSSSDTDSRDLFMKAGHVGTPPEGIPDLHRYIADLFPAISDLMDLAAGSSLNLKAPIERMAMLRETLYGMAWALPSSVEIDAPLMRWMEDVALLKSVSEQQEAQVSDIENLVELQAMVEKLRRKVVAAKLSDPTRASLINHLDEMRGALGRVAEEGVAPLEAAVQRAVGHRELDPDFKEELENSKFGRKFIGLLMLLAAVFSPEGAKALESPKPMPALPSGSSEARDIDIDIDVIDINEDVSGKSQGSSDSFDSSIVNEDMDPDESLVSGGTQGG